MQPPINIDLHECFSMIMHARVYYSHQALSLLYKANYSHDMAVFTHYRKNDSNLRSKLIQPHQVYLSISIRVVSLAQKHVAHSVLLRSFKYFVLACRICTVCIYNTAENPMLFAHCDRPCNKLIPLTKIISQLVLRGEHVCL